VIKGIRLVSALALFCSCSLLTAQEFRATITGQVTDPTGAAIAGAKVRAVQRSTNQATEAVTNQDGYYSLNYLQPSAYDVEVTAVGFDRLLESNVTLLVAEKRSLPFHLKVGDVRTEIKVTADTPEVQSADASGGMNFDALQASELPMNGRQVYMLMDLTPGVQFTTETFGATGNSGTRSWDASGAYVMNGGVQGTNSFSLNGAPISLSGTWQFSPNADAIQEFKVMTNTYDASVGRTGGGSVNTILKSGSNQWHGTAYDYIRNAVLDSNFTQNNRVGAGVGKHITHNFGGTFGGPIRRDKDFIFFSYDGYREINPFPQVANVPPVDLRDGQHFTQYNMLVYDPLTVRPCATGDPAACNTTYGGYTRSPFPGNVLPTSRISPIAQKALSYFPTPNLPGIQQNFVYDANTGRYHIEQPLGRWDHMWSNGDRLGVTVTFQKGREYRNSTGIPGAAAGGDINHQRITQNYITTYTHIISPTALFDVRASFGRYTDSSPRLDTTSGVTAQSLGMTGMIHAPTTTANYPPEFLFDQFTGIFGLSSNANQFNWRTENQWSFAPTLTLTRATHTIRNGVDLAFAAMGTGDTGMANGQFTFNRTASQRYPKYSLNASDGASIADMLLGVPDSGFIDWQDTFYRTWPYWGIFVHDDWKVSRNITLNIGLRYDVQIPFKERFNRVNDGFDFSAVSPYNSQILAAWNANKAAWDKANPTKPYYPAPPAAIFGSVKFLSPGSRRPFQTDWTDLQPRLGLAWQFAPQTVLRTGFGIYYRMATQTSAAASDYADGFNQRTDYLATPDGYAYTTPLTGPYSLVNPFPNGLVTPNGAKNGPYTDMGNAVNFDGQQHLIPRTYQYSFGLQRMLPWQFRVDASYVGSITVHDFMAYNMDYVPLSTYQAAYKTNAILNTSVPNPFYGILPVNSTFGASPNISVQNLNYMYPQFNGITMQTNPWGRWRYDSLQLRGEKRFLGSDSRIGGMTMVLSYTFSKAFDMSHRLNNWNLAEDPVHELTAYDKPQSIAYNGVWMIPFGKGRHYLSHTPKAIAPIVDGWQASWTYRFTSGLAVAGMNYLYKCPDSMLVDDQSHDHWFNNTASCWAGWPSYTIRTIPDRYAWLRQMDNSTLNVAMNKTFSITERWRFTFRAEAFNAMNHPLYGAPDTTRTDARFGMLPVGQQNFPRYIQLSGKLQF
jgi:hypothetical protein